MANIIDYIKWRGDLDLQIDPFNDIDGLILSELAYVDFDKIVPTFLSKESRSLEDVANDIYYLNDLDKLMDEFSFIKDAIILLKIAAKSKRYKNILLSDYLNELDYQAVKQFAAITFQLPDSSIYVAFRGTDDTILGWKEDFMMTYTMPIPSQIRAKEYLSAIARKKYNKSLFYLLKNRSFQTSGLNTIKNYFNQYFFGVKMRLGGHSKGGNLAVYAACNSSEKIINRIIEIYNNDGPGFNQEILEIPEYQKIAKKIKKFVPEGCVFGIMLEYLEEMIVVKSDAKGLMQHSGFTWQIEGIHFVESKAINAESQAMDTAFKSWLVKVDEETRKNAVECLFSIIEAAGIKKINDFSEKTFTHLIAALKELKNMDSESRNALIQFFKVLLVENNNSRKEYKKNKS